MSTCVRHSDRIATNYQPSTRMSNQKSYEPYSPSTGMVLYGRGPTGTPLVCPINESYSLTSPIIDPTELDLNIYDKDFKTPENQTKHSRITTPEFLLLKTQKKRSRFLQTTSIPCKHKRTLSISTIRNCQKIFRSAKRKLEVEHAKAKNSGKQ